MELGRFRDAAWDNQLDNMLDDLQASVQGGGGGGAHTTREYQEKNEANRREVREKMTKTAGGDGAPYSYREERQYMSSTTTTPGTPMGSKRGALQNGSMDTHTTEERRHDSEVANRGRSDSLVADLSSIAKVKSVSKTAYSESRYEYSTTTSNTQQSIKKNINDLDHLLSNLSSHNNSREVSPSRRAPSSSVAPHHPGSSPFPGHHTSSTSHMSRTEERRERLMSNASQYRSPSLGRTPSHSRPQSRPHSPTHHSTPHHGHTHHLNGGGYYPSRTPEPELHSRHITNTSTIKSNISSEFSPVHTTPDPLTGRYADGRITPNHGYTRNFSHSAATTTTHNNNNSPLLARKGTDANANIPRRPEELLSSLGQEVDTAEINRIIQEENVSLSRKEMMKREVEEELPLSRTTPGPPVYYPTGDLFTRKEESVVEGGGGAREHGGYFASAYEREKGSRSKEESGEKGGAAVIPICLPLCCAAPCNIL